MFKGSTVALITSIKNNKIDYLALENLIEWHIKSGTDAVLVCGSTGEGLLLRDFERIEIIRKSVEITKKRIPIIVGCSSCSTFEAIKLVNEAQENCADGVLVIAPFYVKPTQTGIIQHFQEVHDNSNIPIIMYNNPGRCAVSMNIDTICKIAELKRVVALKDSDTNLARVHFLRQNCNDLTLLSGDDSTYPGYLAHGGDGCISVSANIAPKLVKAVYNSWIKSDIKEFQDASKKLAALSEVMFIESNPIPVKYALSKMGFIANELRLPLLPASQSAAIKIDEVLGKIFEK